MTQEQKINEQKVQMMQQYNMKLQMLDQQMRQLQENLMQVERQKADLQIVQQSLDDLKKTKIGNEILVPVSSGIFAKAELKDNSKLLVNVGGNTTVERTIEETKEMLSKQMNEVAKLEKDLEAQLKKLAEEAIHIETEINSKK